MAGELPDYFFRVRENGAVVFRVDTENRQRRIDMEEIATVNVNNGKIKPHGDRLLTKAETALMEDWNASMASPVTYWRPAMLMTSCARLTI